MLKDFINLIYPKVCSGCKTVLLKNETLICTTCLSSLPKLDYYKHSSNPVEKLFWGKIEINMAFSAYKFSKGSIIQQLIHSLKYEGKTDVGIILGVELGKSILSITETNNHFDVIIPVPLHKKRLKERTYNQSLFIAKGISKVINVNIDESILSRENLGSSQTKKTKFSRWLNVAEDFKVNKEKDLKNKNILLVDDVITTGSTLVACGQALNKYKNIKLSIVSLACV